jgi:hypothetical protein
MMAAAKAWNGEAQHGEAEGVSVSTGASIGATV